MPFPTKEKKPLERMQCVNLTCVSRRNYCLLTGCRSTRTLNDDEIEEGPVVKKRKLGNGTSASQAQSRPSFADVLERLKKEEGTNATGALELPCRKILTCLSDIYRGRGWCRLLGTPKVRQNRPQT